MKYSKEEYLAGRARYSILREASAILEKIPGLVLTHQGIQQEGKTLRPGRVVGLLKKAQMKHQTSYLHEKIIHGEFFVGARRRNGMSRGATSGCRWVNFPRRVRGSSLLRRMV